MRKLFYGLFFGLILLASSCNEPQKDLNIDVSQTPKPSIKIKRYEQAMFRIPSDSFIAQMPQMQKEFPIFLEGDISDTAALIELKSFFFDPYMKQLYQYSMEQFPSLDQVEDELADAMQHYYYYFPYAENYNYYSYVSGLDASHPVKFMGNNLVIGVDNYLSNRKDIYFKSGFPKYQVKWLTPERVVPDCMNEIASGLLPEQAKGESLLDNMIYQGKLLYFAQAMQPTIADSLLLKYSKAQYEWCRHFEGKIWGVMIDNQFLFKKETTLVGKFMNDGPFTTVFSKSSPARTGWFVGWRIVSAYMARTDASLMDLFQENDSQKILKLSKYKPEN